MYLLTLPGMQVLMIDPPSLLMALPSPQTLSSVVFPPHLGFHFFLKHFLPSSTDLFFVGPKYTPIVYFIKVARDKSRGQSLGLSFCFILFSTTVASTLLVPERKLESTCCLSDWTMFFMFWGNQNQLLCGTIALLLKL